MHTESRHRLAVCRGFSLVVQCVELAEEFARLGKRGSGWSIEPRELSRIHNAGDGQAEREWREIPLEYLGRSERLQGRVLAFGPEAITHPGRGSSGAAATLIRRGARHAERFESRHARPR